MRFCTSLPDFTQVIEVPWRKTVRLRLEYNQQGIQKRGNKYVSI